MDLLEYQGKQLFAKHGVTVPEGRPATSVQEAVEAAEELGYPVVIKAQVLIGGRGKAGGIKLAKDRSEAEEHANAILGMDIRGFTVHELYVEKAAERDPNAIVRIHIDPLVGFQAFQGRRLAFEAGIAEDVVRPVGALLSKLYDTFVAEDATLVEINPLLITKGREVVALDSK